MICPKKEYKFFYNKIKKHYALIIGENSNKYYYLTLTHSQHYYKYDNLELLKNPNKKDSSKAYIVSKINKADKKFFKNTGKHLSLSILDKELIDLKIIEPSLKKNFEAKIKGTTFKTNEIISEEQSQKVISNNKKTKIIELIKLL